MQVFIARQPIYNRNLEISAYELLYREGMKNEAGVIDDAEKASTHVIVNTFLEIGLEKMTGGLPALVNVSRELLMTGVFPSQFSGRLVPELLETIEVDDGVISAVKALVSQGYQIALDDFEYHPSWLPLVEIADIIKIDVLALKENGVLEQLKAIAPHTKPTVKLLAEKVETEEEYAFYRSCGFDYFQGYFLARPKVIKNKVIPTSKLLVLKLIQKLNQPDISPEVISQLICQDARLSYKLLLLINSVSFGLPRKIESIQEAVVFLGFVEMKNWASFMALSSAEGRHHPLLLTAMVRARMCEKLALRLKLASPEAYFTMGLVSLLDVLMNVQLDDLLHELNFSDEIQQAVLGKKGEMGQVLQAVLAYEKGEWDEVNYHGLLEVDVWQVYLESVEWAEMCSNI